MHRPITLTYRRMIRSAAIESAARNVGERLKRSNHHIGSCHITLDGGATAESEPAQYSVKIHLSLPGAQIHAGSSPRSGGGHHDVLAALCEAYGDAVRQLTALRRQPIFSPARPFRA